MALRGLAYSVRMAAYNVDGVRVTGLASTITATLWADGTAVTLSGITITEIGSTGVYVVPLTATQMEAYNLCVTATSSTAGITFDPVYLDTEAGRIDVATSTRLATSGYTTPPTVNDIQSGLAKTSEIASSLSSVMTVLTDGVLADIATVDGAVDAIALRMPSSGTVATSDDIPTPPTVADIQSGLAKSIEIPTVNEIQSGLATTSEIATVDGVVDAIYARMPISGTVATSDDIPTPPTPTAIADVVVPRVLETDLTTLDNAAAGSLKTLVLLQVNAGMVDPSRLVVYEADGSEHAHYRVTTDADTGISSVRFPTD